MTRRSQNNNALILAAVLLASVSGCDNGEPAAPCEPEDALPLSNGAWIRATDSGEAELLVGCRPTVALPRSVGPRARSFVEHYSGSLGIWNVLRTDEEVFELDTFAGVEASGDEVILTYESDDGGWTGQVTFSPASDDVTRVWLEVEGPKTPSSVALPVRCDPDGTFHGFGEQYNATDQRGEAFQLLVTEQGIGRDGALRYFTGDEHTTYFPMPWYLDARGFGVLIETGFRVDVDLCAADAEVAWLEVISSEPVEALIFHGPTPLEVLRQLGDHLGRPAPMPEWAYGLWVGAQGGREEVLAEADRLEDNDIPTTALWVQDWTGTRMNIGGGFGVQYRWEADEELYPDLAGMIDELHGRGYRFLAYANPFVDPELDNHFPEMDEAGLLITHPTEGGSYVFSAPNGESSHPDLSNPATCEYVKDALRAMVEDYGIDGWMADFAEWTPLDAQNHAGIDPLVFHNTFPIEWQRMTREVMEEVRPEGDWVMFARSGWTGVQQVAQIHWAGDQEATWSETDGLPTVVPALLNLGLSGQPHVTHDIAGFSGGPSTKELFLRWVELGAFTPIMRTHEGNEREENWSWESDTETTEHFRRFVQIHQALAPDFMTLAEEAQQSSAPILRHLMLVFPDDPATYPISDQFMIGDQLLVAPVVSEGATSREVYLPAGSWYHLWTGDRFEGGQTVEVDAPIGSPPAFSRDRDRADLRAIE